MTLGRDGEGVGRPYERGWADLWEGRGWGDHMRGMG